MKWTFLLLFLSAWAFAEQKKTVYNPFTGKLDFITTLSSGTLPSGSTFYIQDNGTGGLFEINTSSPGSVVQGQYSFSNVDGSIAWWVWVNGHRYRLTPVLLDP